MKLARYHPSAREELRAAVQYSETERGGRGVALELAVRRVVRRLQLAPKSAPQWPQGLKGLEVRRAVVRRHPYLVVYVVLADQLVILAVAHMKRRPGYWRDRVQALK